ncbi:MAG TPA: DUF1302 family protein, partial [Ramlibacter sp.]|nr:DUF1302 family protein [Ramlibacter sp.]
VENRDPALVGGPNYDAAAPTYFPNTDDGNRNFKRGLVSNRLDLLSEFDVAYKGFGVRMSAAAWRDSVYLRSTNDHDSPSTSNAISVPYNVFPRDTRDLMGSDAELLDAFVFGKFDLAGRPVSLKLGKHTVLYGESLMLGANGIAAAQAGIDVVKAVAVPNSQFKEFMRPVNQVSGQVQLTPDVMVGGYYLLGRTDDRLPAAGSYFSTVDLIAAGAERLIVGNSPAGNVGFYREADMKAKRGGQGGLQLRFHGGDVDYGLYAVRWNDRGPSGLYLNPLPVPSVSAAGLQVGKYQWVYHEGIRAVGGSFSTTVGNVNLAGEVSVRGNTPLASDAQLNVTGANNSGNVLYAVGKSAHAQMSWIASVGPSFLSREADFVGEIAWNRRLSITRNANALNPNATRDAANLRMVFEPKYRQVVPGLDLGVPIGLGYGLSGNSSVVPPFLGKKTGDLSVGLNGTYLGVWQFGLNLTHYFGPTGQAIEGGHGTYKQALADRDFLSLSVRRTF